MMKDFTILRFHDERDFRRCIAGLSNQNAGSDTIYNSNRNLSKVLLLCYVNLATWSQ